MKTDIGIRVPLKRLGVGNIDTAERDLRSRSKGVNIISAACPHIGGVHLQFLHRSIQILLRRNLKVRPITFYEMGSYACPFCDSGIIGERSIIILDGVNMCIMDLLPLKNLVVFAPNKDDRG